MTKIILFIFTVLLFPLAGQESGTEQAAPDSSRQNPHSLYIKPEFRITDSIDYVSSSTARLSLLGGADIAYRYQNPEQLHETSLNFRIGTMLPPYAFSKTKDEYTLKWDGGQPYSHYGVGLRYSGQKAVFRNQTKSLYVGGEAEFMLDMRIFPFLSYTWQTTVTLGPAATFLIDQQNSSFRFILSLPLIGIG